mmetsp:Transcript_11136/g.33560  ORF Transcript_11136/g.33560 Transcript_11136/m.33560 type:complete len:236 (+) Transcript_11136:847-1554(+)
MVLGLLHSLRDAERDPLPGRVLGHEREQGRHDQVGTAPGHVADRGELRVPRPGLHLGQLCEREHLDVAGRDLRGRHARPPLLRGRGDPPMPDPAEDDEACLGPSRHPVRSAVRVHRALHGHMRDAVRPPALRRLWPGRHGRGRAVCHRARDQPLCGHVQPGRQQDGLLRDPRRALPDALAGVHHHPHGLLRGGAGGQGGGARRADAARGLRRGAAARYPGRDRTQHSRLADLLPA